MAGTTPVNATPADNSLATTKYVNDSVTFPKRTVLGNVLNVAYYQAPINFDTVNGTVTIPISTRFRSGMYSKIFDVEQTITTGSTGYHLYWDVKNQEVKTVTFVASSANHTENLIMIASVSYPMDSARIKVEGLENYWVNGKPRLIPSTEQTYLGKAAHIILGYGRKFNLNTATKQLEIPSDVVFKNGKYTFRTAGMSLVTLLNGYNLVYLDTETNTFIRLAYNTSAVNYQERYLFVCSISLDDNATFNDIQGINKYTINGVRGKLSDFENDLNLETVKYSMDHPLFTPKKLRLAGHRGLSGLKPENTIPAFEECGIRGMFGVETDIRKTSDGHFVCIHDETVDRTTNGTGNVADMTLAQIKSLTVDYGAGISEYANLKVPTLQEMLYSCAKYGTTPLLHLYTAIGDEPAIVKIVNELGFEKSVIYTASSPTMLNNFSKNSNSLVFTLGSSASDLTLIKPPVNNYEGVNYDYSVYANYPNAIKELHAVKKIVAAWVVNDPLVVKELFEKGVDLISTDNLFEF